MAADAVLPEILPVDVAAITVAVMDAVIVVAAVSLAAATAASGSFSYSSSVVAATMKVVAMDAVMVVAAVSLAAAAIIAVNGSSGSFFCPSSAAMVTDAASPLKSIAKSCGTLNGTAALF